MGTEPTAFPSSRLPSPALWLSQVLHLPSHNFLFLKSATIFFLNHLSVSREDEYQNHSRTGLLTSHSSEPGALPLAPLLQLRPLPPGLPERSGMEPWSGEALVSCPGGKRRLLQEAPNPLGQSSEPDSPSEKCKVTESNQLSGPPGLPCRHRGFLDTAPHCDRALWDATASRPFPSQSPRVTIRILLPPEA